MPRYSEDLREQAVKYVEAGNSYKAASEIFGATAEAISNWHRRYLEFNHVRYFPHLGKKARVSDEDFINYVKEHPDDTLKQIGSYFEMTEVGALYYMRKTGISYKKKSRDTRKRAKKEGKNI